VRVGREPSAARYCLEKQTQKEAFIAEILARLPAA
jgi:hypothetical protein